MKKRVILAAFMVLTFVLFSSLAFAQSRGGGRSGGGGHSGGGGRSGGYSYGSGSSHYSGGHGSWSHGYSSHGSGWGFRFYAYPGWGWSYPYAYPYSYPYPYYSPPPVVSQEAPVYSEPEQEQPYYWYYCENPKGYYPYIKSCPGGWMKVVPDVTPPNP